MIRFAPEQSTGPVSILGEWNAFAPEPLTSSNGVSTWKGTLEARDYGYRFALGSATPITDPANPFRRWVGDVEQSRLRVPDCTAPLLEVTKFQSTPAGTASLEVQASLGKGGVALSPPVITVDGAAAVGTFDAASGRLTVSPQALAEGKHTLRVTLSDQQGKPAVPLYLPFWIEPEPFVWSEALLYFVFTDRFADGDLSNDLPAPNVDPRANYQGGDFRGVIQKINEGYFDRLGVRALWLSPFDANPDGAFPGSLGKLYTGYHGYWPSKAREVQQRFGTILDLQELTAAAHKHGMRVVADLVLNHTHQEHPYYRDHKGDGWFNVSGSCICGDPGCDWDVRRLDCWFASYLPDYNWRSPAQNEQVVSDVLFWLENADLDGFRLDAIKHLEHAGGRNVAGSVNAIGELTGNDFYLVGETFTGVDGRPLLSEYLGPNELDGQFDFPLYWPVIDAFAKGGPLEGVDDAVNANESFYGPQVLNAPFLGNHDVPRFISQAAGEIDADPSAQAWNNPPAAQASSDLAFARAKWAFTFLLTQRGVPLIYYGDEIGMPGAGDPDNRRMMRFDAALGPREVDLLGFVRKLGVARKQSRALRFGLRFTLAIEDDLYVFQRDDSAEAAVVAINRGGARTISVTAQGALSKAAPRSYTDVFSGKQVMLGGAAAVSLSLDPGAAAVFLPSP